MRTRRNLLKGQTLIEVMVAMAVGVLVLTAITSSVLTSLVNSRVSSESNEASQFVQQGLEIARSSRTAAAGTYCLDEGTDKLTGIPQGTCTTANINGKYIRTVDVQKGTAGECGIDVNKAVVTVKWTDSKCTDGAYCHKSVVSTCVNALALAGTITPTAPAPGSPTVNLNATLTTITTGNSTTLSWTSTNASNCTATGGTGWAGSKSASGSVTVSPTSNTTYSIYCTSSLGVNSSTAQRAIVVNPLPTASLTASTNPIIAGNSTTLTWGSTNATTCTDNGWTASSASSGTQVVSPASTTTYTIYCTSADGYNSSPTTQRTVTVNPPPPTVNLTAATTNLASGASTTLSWFVTNSSSCTKSLDWSGTVAGADGGPTSTGALTTSKDYRLTCTGLDGSTVFDDVHISVGKTTVLFYPTEDAYISEQSPNSNFGTSNYLRSGSDGNSANRYNSYLKFDISSLAASRTVVSANFKMTLCRTADNALCTGTGAIVRLRGASGTWSESTVCWSTSVSPCTARPTNGSTEVTIASGLAQGTAITSDLTTYFSDKLGTTTSLALTTDNAYNGYSMFYSKGATATADRPQLTIVSEL